MLAVAVGVSELDGALWVSVWWGGGGGMVRAGGEGGAERQRPPNCGGDYVVLGP